jgi:TetR/AcrR family transcriptional regulator, transcriptional repressor for nem operon
MYNHMTSQNKRDRLIESAAILFHHNGTTATSLADIAKHADIPIGNVYYYFKTKEELALAAINKRKDQFTAAYQILDENIADPRQRIIEAVKYFDKVNEEYTAYGCPIGKIIEDADTQKDAVAQTAAQVLKDFVAWTEQQFRHLGHGDDAHIYATTLMAGIQGATIMAKAFRDPKVISREMARLVLWVESLPNKRIHLGKLGMRSVDSSASNAA